MPGGCSPHIEVNFAIATKTGETRLMNRRIGVFTLLATVFAASGAALAQERKPDTRDLIATKEKGWVSLFDGKTLGGWKTYDGKGQWEVEDGVIHGFGPASHLFSPR